MGKINSLLIFGIIFSLGMVTALNTGTSGSVGLDLNVDAPLNYSGLIVNLSTNHSASADTWITDQGALSNPSDILANGMWTRTGTDLYPTNIADSIGVGLIPDVENILKVDGTKGNFTYVNPTTNDFIKFYMMCNVLGFGDSACVPMLSGQSLTPILTTKAFGIENGIFLIGIDNDPALTFYSGDISNTSNIRYDRIDDTLNFEGTSKVNFLHGDINLGNILYLNRTTNRIGIGTFNPTHKLEVVGSVRSTNFITTGAGGSDSGRTWIGEGINLTDMLGTGITAIGLFSGNGSSGNDNLMIGSYAGAGSVGEGKMFFGHASGLNSLGNHTAYIGFFSGNENKGNNNVGIGSYAGDSNVGNYNTFLGVNSGRTNKASYVSALGYYSGSQNTGNNSVFLGYRAGLNNPYNDLFIVANDTNTLLWGNFSSGRIGIGTTTPQNKLNVVGDLNVTGTIYNSLSHVHGLATDNFTTAVVGVWYNITMNRSLFDNEGFTALDDNITIVVQNNAHYFIEFGMGFRDVSPSPTGLVRMRITRNGNEIIGSNIPEFTSKQNSFEWMEHTTHVELNFGDEIRMQYLTTDVDINVTTDTRYVEQPFTAYGYIQEVIV